MRSFREAALAIADGAVEMARRQIALAEENRVLRQRLAELEGTTVEHEVLL